MIFDLFPRDLVVVKAANDNAVGYITTQLTASHIATDLVTDPDGVRVDLYQRRVGVSIHTVQGTLNFGQNLPVAVELTQPRPYPLVASGIPPAALNPDGSYSFTPVVVGGYGPYTFELTGELLTDGFVFDSSTGTLSRQPE